MSSYGGGPALSEPLYHADSAGAFLPPTKRPLVEMLEINVTENFCEKVILHLQDNGTLDTCFMNDKQNNLRISCFLTVTGNQSPSALASAFQV